MDGSLPPTGGATRSAADAAVSKAEIQQQGRRDHWSTAAGGAASGAIDRRTVLAGAAGALLGVALAWPSLAGAGAASPESLADVPFDPMLARRLQQALDGAVAGSSGRIPGVILYVERAGHGSWAGGRGTRPAGSSRSPASGPRNHRLSRRSRLPLRSPCTDPGRGSTRPGSRSGRDPHPSVTGRGRR